MLFPLLLALVLPAFRAGAAPQPAPLLSPGEVIDLVNQLRLANGLPAYKVNQSLMAAAQAHSEYQASIGQVTHTGQGGNRARDRAAAYGFGDGGTIFVSENIAGGMNLSAAEAVEWWQGDSLHLNTMLGASYTDAGAGMAEADGRVYYTLDVGYVAGQAGSGSSSGSSSAGGSPAAQTPAATAVVILPVQAATPRPDGSIIHEVQQGQALWNIAAVYQVSLADLMALNGFTQSTLIFPGDKILVRLAQATSTPTASETPTSTLTPTRTPPPTGTPTAPIATAIALKPTSGDMATPSVAPPNLSSGFDPLLGAIIALVILGVGLIAFGSILKKPAR